MGAASSLSNSHGDVVRDPLYSTTYGDVQQLPSCYNFWKRGDDDIVQDLTYLIHNHPQTVSNANIIHRMFNFALTHERRELISSVLDNGIDLNGVDNAGNSVIHIAARTGDSIVLNRLVCESSLDINLSNQKGQTALHIAAMHNRPQVMDILLQRPDANVNVQNSKGETALFISASRGRLNLVHVLLQRNDVDADIKADNGDTPLISAVCNHHAGVVRVLLEQGRVNVILTNAKGYTCMEIAILERLNKIIATFFSVFTIRNLPEPLRSQLVWYACRHGHMELLQSLLAIDEIDPNIKLNDQTPLWVAVRQHRKEIVEKLCADPRIDVNVHCQGSTALHLACMQGHYTLAKLLVSCRNVRVDARVCGGGNVGKTSLDLAIEWGHVHIVRLLSTCATVEEDAATKVDLFGSEDDGRASMSENQSCCATVEDEAGLTLASTCTTMSGYSSASFMLLDNPDEE